MNISDYEEAILNNPVLVIAHAPCIDGFCSALVFHTYLTRLMETTNRMVDFDIIRGDHANKLDNIPDVEGKVVFIVDFSYPREVLLEMADKAESLVVLDHHVSAEKDLEGLDFCHFDMTRSGAKLAAEFVNLNDWAEQSGYPALPTIVGYVSDRDLWNFDLPESKTINDAIDSWPYHFNTSTEFARSAGVWLEYAAKSVVDFIDTAVYEGGVVRRQLDKMITDAISFRHNGHIQGETISVPVVNTLPHIVSDTLHRILTDEDHPYVIGWYFNGDKYVYSLRSKDHDVSELAKRYGGGGHKAAAGFVSLTNLITLDV